MPTCIIIVFSFASSHHICRSNIPAVIPLSLSLWWILIQLCVAAVAYIFTHESIILTSFNDVVILIDNYKNTFIIPMTPLVTCQVLQITSI